MRQDLEGKFMAAEPLHILLVDDHAESVRVLAKLLRRYGHEVREAGTVTEAYDAALADPPDVLVSDLELPDGSGCELVRKIRAEHPSVRAVALSGHSGQPYVTLCRNAGFEVLLTKGMEFDRIMEAIGRRSLPSLGGVPSPRHLATD